MISKTKKKMLTRSEFKNLSINYFLVPENMNFSQAPPNLGRRQSTTNTVEGKLTLR